MSGVSTGPKLVEGQPGTCGWVLDFQSSLSTLKFEFLTFLVFSQPIVFDLIFHAEFSLSIILPSMYWRCQSCQRQ